ncbi:NUDIX hydrolase domain-like protein [Ochromonadaceae sp. CCMP2298]|nr:NUDIX hydrolase domain-like protein [Ochromonadaceae sp. CCMP2298]|mmetsp:Transcript_19317/g.43064  ORF Transcript_19317/g.43064 Transcript_19317/m.43064 type:complete len:224 (-) Transcript_19317:894-1565(-)
MKFTAQWVSRMRAAVAASKDGRLFIAPIPKKIAQPVIKQAAVLIALCNRHGEASVLFTLRSNTVGTHKGQVSFPGGHMDKGESEVDAAFRETYEELGSGIGDIELIGLCQTIPAKTGTPVTPVVGFLSTDVGDFEDFCPSADEVDRVFTRSLAQLTDPGYKRYEMLSGRKSDEGKTFRFPVFGGGGEDADTSSAEYEERVWGFTALVLEKTLEHLIIPTQEKE